MLVSSLRKLLNELTVPGALIENSRSFCMTWSEFSSDHIWLSELPIRTLMMKFEPIADETASPYRLLEASNDSLSMY